VLEEQMAAIVLFYRFLEERCRRMNAGLQALKIGQGGDTENAELSNMNAGPWPERAGPPDQGHRARPGATPRRRAPLNPTGTSEYKPTEHRVFSRNSQN